MTADTIEAAAPAEVQQKPVTLSRHGKKMGRPTLAELEARRKKEEEAAQAAADIASAEDQDEFETAEEITARGPLDFFEWISNAFSAEDWGSNLVMYLWRTAPTIDRKGNGKPSNIQKYCECVDSHQIMMDHGSGGYRIDLCQVTQPSGKMKRIAQHRFQILNLDFPPKVPAGEWLEDPVNNTWAWARARIEAAQAQSNSAAAMGMTSMMDPSKLFDQMATTVKSFMPPQGQQGTDPAITAILTGLMAERQKPTVADPTVEILREALQESRTELREMRKEMRERSAQPAQKTLAEQITELQPVVTLLNPKSKGHDGFSWEELIGNVATKFVEVAPMLVAAWQTGQTGQVPTNGFAGASPAARVPVIPQLNAPAAAPNQQQEEAPMPAPLTEAEQQIIQKYSPLFQQVAMHMIDCFKNVDGLDFREWIIDRHPGVWEELRRDITPEVFCDLIGKHSLLRTQIAPREAALKFFTEFFSDRPDVEPEAEAAQ